MAARMILRKATVTPAAFNRRSYVLVRASEKPVETPAAVEQPVSGISVPAADVAPTPTPVAVTTDNKTVSFGGKEVCQ